MKNFSLLLLLIIIAILVHTQKMYSQIPSDGLVAYYPFNGNANDESIGNNDGTVYGPVLVEDRFNNSNSAYLFDGVNDYILTETNNQLDQYTFGSVSFWIKPLNGAPDIVQSIISYSTLEFNNSVYHFSLFQNQINVSFKYGGSYYTPVIEANGILEGNKWYYIVVTADGINKIKIYINGIEQSTIFKPFVTSADGTEWFSDFYGTNIYNHFVGIGAVKRSSSTASYFNGVIDDIKIYDYILSVSEIIQTYNENGWLNTSPIVDAGEDQMVECSGVEGTEITLDGSGSSDPDGDELTYTWYLNDEMVAGPSADPTANLTLDLGSYTFTLNISDGIETSTDEVVVDIIDTTPPALTIKEPITLWPPNHKYVTVNITKMVTSIEDGCSGELLLSDAVITKVTSDEPENDNGNGDGNTIEDIVIAEGCNSVDLRAERDENGNGRVYTITVAAKDYSDNEGTAEYKVLVPIGNNDIATKDNTQYLAEGTCEVPVPSVQLVKNIGNDNKVVGNEAVIPTEYQLLQNYPNPFNPATNIQFSIPGANYVSLKIYDLLGKEIAVLVDETKSSGSYTYEFDGSNLTSGVYVYRLQAGEFVSTKKLVLMK